MPSQELTFSYRTFSEAANETGISRRYGGIHFVEGDLRGRTAGRSVGAQAWAKALQYFNTQNGDDDDDQHDKGHKGSGHH